MVDCRFHTKCAKVRRGGKCSCRSHIKGDVARAAETPEEKIVQHRTDTPRQYRLPPNLGEATRATRAEAAITYESTLRGRPWPNNSTREADVQIHFLPLEGLCTAIGAMAQGRLLTVVTKPPAGLHGCTKCRGAPGGCRRCLDSADRRPVYTPPTPVYVIA